MFSMLTAVYSYQRGYMYIVQQMYVFTNVYSNKCMYLLMFTKQVLVFVYSFHLLAVIIVT